MSPRNPPTLPTKLSSTRSARALAAVAAVALACCGCAGSASKAAPADSPVAPRPATSDSLGRVRIISRVPQRERFQLPAGFAVSYDAGGRHYERAGQSAEVLSVGPVQNLVITSTRAALLLHRLAELHSRLGPRQFPIGADRHNRLHIGRLTYWTTGFWPGALWQGVGLTGSPLLRSWALRSTVNHFGEERNPTHDVGFVYGQSSLAAWEALCAPGGAPASGRGPASLCARLRHSVLTAAGELVALARSNPGNGLIPTSPAGPVGITIVDSMMNIHILPWASQQTGNPVYARLANHQAQLVGRLLVRRNGSTAQAANYERSSGRILSISTHQGISARSTWSRGQGWAVYGFAQAARDLRSRALLRIALRVARYVGAHLPPSGVPLWDYDAHVGAPVDTSAGAITAAGLFHLAASCRALPGVCSAPRWVALGRRMLLGVLGHVSEAPPLGFLGGQALNERAHGCWCNDAELSFGLSYALEAVRLAAAV